MNKNKLETAVHARRTASKRTPCSGFVRRKSLPKREVLYDKKIRAISMCVNFVQGRFCGMLAFDPVNNLILVDPTPDRVWHKVHSSTDVHFQNFTRKLAVLFKLNNWSRSKVQVSKTSCSNLWTRLWRRRYRDWIGNQFQRMFSFGP